MEIVTRDFNKVARTWDEEPRRVKMAGDVADCIAKNVPLTSSMDVMDFGCGTGLLTLNIQPQVRSITGVDSSQGMLDILRTKIESLRLENVTALCKNLERGDVLDGSFHLVTSCMTLHHVREIEPLLSSFHTIIHPGGSIAIADLDLDDGQFHEDNTGIFHSGFDRDKLQQEFLYAGFRDVRFRTATSVFKPIADGGTREFTIFLVTGRKM